MMKRLLLLAAAALEACDTPAAGPVSQEVRLHAIASLPGDPEDPVWAAVPVHAADLRQQDMVEPRKMAGGTKQIRIRGLTDGRSVAFRLDWIDATMDSIRIPARFSDACAVQLPEVLSPDLPAPQMGEKGRVVQISYWSAAAQASVDGRPDDLKSFYPNAQVDHYPFDAPGLEKSPDDRERMRLRYAPARAVGNPAAGPAKKSVQDLVAQGPGTLAPAALAMSDGKGKRTVEGWSVVITRPLPAGLKPGSRSYASFAVWNGSEEDAGSRKLWVPWTPLFLPGPVASK